MNFIEKLASYTLGNLSAFSLPDFAITAINENIESESLIILAGMSGKDSAYELDRYFNRSLAELNILLPDKLHSAKILIRYYLNEMIKNQNEAFNIMGIIENEVYKRVDWKSELKLSEMKYVGAPLGLEKMYTWYRELQDWDDGSNLLYYNELPKELQKIKFEQHLIEEAKILKEILNREIPLSIL